MAVDTEKTIRNQVLYSIYVRNYSEAGTFTAVQADLDRIKALGTDIIWLLPIHPTGEKHRKGTLGSPYAIRDYRAVNPEFGTLDDFRHLVDAIHDRGMKCIIDVVYNHTSPDSVLAHDHPEFFLRDEQGRPTRKVADWWDIVDLDYSVPALWTYQIDTLKQWAAIVDGFRCDVASSVPIEFWEQARREVETVRPGCIWLAESVHGAYIREMRRMGAACSTDTDLYRAFDMTYDYDLWPCYEAVLKGELPLCQFTDLLTYQELTYPTGYVKARCVENHDTPRLASYLSNERQLYNWLAFLYFRRGAAMLYGGTELACRHQVSLFDKDDNFGDRQLDLSDFLRRCKAMKTTLPLTGAVWYDCRGTAAIGMYDGPDGAALGVFDLSGSGAPISIDLPDGTYENRLGGVVIVNDGQLPAESTPVVI